MYLATCNFILNDFVLKIAAYNILLLILAMYVFIPKEPIVAFKELRNVKSLLFYRKLLLHYNTGELVYELVLRHNGYRYNYSY